MIQSIFYFEATESHIDLSRILEISKLRKYGERELSFIPSGKPETSMNLRKLYYGLYYFSIKYTLSDNDSMQYMETRLEERAEKSYNDLISVWNTYKDQFN